MIGWKSRMAFFKPIGFLITNVGILNNEKLTADCLCDLCLKENAEKVFTRDK